MDAYSAKRGSWFKIFFLHIIWLLWIPQAWAESSPIDVNNFRKEARELIGQAKAGSDPDRDARYEKAISALQQAFRLDEHSYTVTNCSLGALFESLNRKEAAAEIYQQTIRLKSGSSLKNLLLGWAYSKLGFYQRAITRYLEMIYVQIDDPETLYELGLLFRDHERKSEAIRFLEEAINRKADYAQAYYALGTLYEFKQDKKALEAFKKTVAFKPNFWQAHMSLGYAHDRLGNLNEALTAYNHVLQIIPEDISKSFVHSQRGEIYQKLNHWQEAAAAFEEAIREKPDDDEVLLKLGLLYGELSRHQDALKTFQRLIQLAPNNAKAYLELASIYYQLGQWHDAVEVLKKATHFNPDYAEAYNKLGEAYGELELYGEAVEAYRRAVLLRPSEFRFCFNLGLVYANLGLHDEAIKAFQQAINCNPHDPEAHYMLGLSFGESGCKQEALEAFQKALSLNPSYLEAYNDLGIVYGELGRYRESAEAHQKALLLSPNDVELMCNMGVAYSDLGQHAEAVENLKQAIHLNPQFSLAFYNLGIVESELGHHQEAIEAFKKALEFEPDFPEAYNNLGLVYKELGQFQEAQSAFEKLVDLMPNYAEAQFNLGLVYLFLDNQGAAEEQYAIIQSYDEKLSQELFIKIEAFKNHKLIMRLITWREKQNINREQLSLLLGLPLETIEKWETGKTKIPPFLSLALDGLDHKLPKPRANHRK